MRSLAGSLADGVLADAILISPRPGKVSSTPHSKGWPCCWLGCEFGHLLDRNPAAILLS